MLNRNFVDSFRDWFNSPVETYIGLWGNDGLAFRILGINITTGRNGFSRVIGLLLWLLIVGFWIYFLGWFIPDVALIIQLEMTGHHFTLDDIRRISFAIYVVWLGVTVRPL